MRASGRTRGSASPTSGSRRTSASYDSSLLVGAGTAGTLRDGTKLSRGERQAAAARQASWSAPLHLFANRKGEELQQPVEESPVPPPLVVDLLRVRQIVGKDLLELARDVLVVQARVELLVEGERPRVQVGAADRRPDAVDGHR